MKKLLLVLSTIISLNAFANSTLPTSNMTQETSFAQGSGQVQHDSTQKDIKTRHNESVSRHYQPHYPAI